MPATPSAQVICTAFRHDAKDDVVFERVAGCPTAVRRVSGRSIVGTDGRPMRPWPSRRNRQLIRDHMFTWRHAPRQDRRVIL